MPRAFRPGRSVRPPRREVFLAISEHEDGAGQRETLRLTPDEVVVVRVRDGETVAEAISLKELERVETRARVGRMELLVALSYLLGASVFLYLVVNLIDRLAGPMLYLVLGVLVAFAAGGVVAAMLGQEAVVRFIGRGRRRRMEYRLPKVEGEKVDLLRSFTRLQDKR